MRNSLISSGARRPHFLAAVGRRKQKFFSALDKWILAIQNFNSAENWFTVVAVAVVVVVMVKNPERFCRDRSLKNPEWSSNNIPIEIEIVQGFVGLK